MGTVADKLAALENTKAGIKAAITEKGQSVGDVFSDYPDAIRAIQTGTDTSDATATDGDILSGKTAYGASGKLTGTIPTVEQATPSISVSDSGLITVSATQSAGYTAGGSKSATQQLETAGGAMITPSIRPKVVVSKGVFTTGNIGVAGDANLVPENIKSGVSIFGVDGSFEGQAIETVSVTNNSSFSVYVSIYTTEGISVGKIYKSSRNDIIKGSILLYGDSTSPPQITGDYENLGYDDFGLGFMLKIRINGNCFFASSGPSEN